MAQDGFILGMSPSRHGFHGAATAGAELAAYTLCKQSINLIGRKRVEGYAIDSADPDSPMDRDDAISIRFHDDPELGHLATLDVSIADVASISPRASKDKQGNNLAALDAFAYKNGESLYFPHGVSPMLPRRLQDRLSLENGKERAAITISVTFNRHGHAIHTEFARTRIKTKCVSYRDAARDILLYGHPIQKISVVANQLLKRKSGVTHLPHYDERTGTYTDAEGNTRHISRDELSAFTTVQGAMIAANEAAAELMSGSPFLFRNHSFAYRNSPAFYRKDELEEFEEKEGRVIQNKAEYSPHCKGHFGLDADKYSHVTSPMRRYADLVNQRMMGWAIDVVEAVTRSILEDTAWNHIACPPEKVSYLVWNHARKLLCKASALRKSGINRAASERKILYTIRTMLSEMAVPKPQSQRIAKAALRSIGALDIPYTIKELDDIASGLNETLTNNRMARREMQINETNRWLDTVFPSPDSKMLKAWGADNFSRLLEAAARRGDNHDVFAQEVSLRLQEDRNTLVQNLTSILVLAQRQKDSHWQELKRQAFQMLKDDPRLGERVFACTQKQRDMQVFILEATLFDRHRFPHPSALVVLLHDGKEYSAPIIDTANTPGKARLAAILTFFRHYGNLHPHQELYTPKLIELALERAKVKRGERLSLIEKICASHFIVETQQQLLDGLPKRLEVTINVTSLEGGQMLFKKRAGSPGTYDQIVDKAAKDMLEDTRFISMISQHHTHDETDDISEDKVELLPRFVWGHAIDRRLPVHGELVT